MPLLQPEIRAQRVLGAANQDTVIYVGVLYSTAPYVGPFRALEQNKKAKKNEKFLVQGTQSPPRYTGGPRPAMLCCQIMPNVIIGL